MGFPGLTTPFGIQVVDDTGLAYDREVTDNHSGCVDPVSRPLPVRYALARDQKGSLSTGSGAGGSTSLEVPVGTPVYFTPGGEGPWSVTAVYSQALLDPAARTLQLPGGGCSRENRLLAPSLRSYTFFIYQPVLRFVRAEDDRPVQGPLRMGEQVRLEVDRLSAWAGGTPAAATLTVFSPAGVQEQAIQIPLHPDASGRLISVVIDPGLQPGSQSPVQVRISDGGWVQATAAGAEASIQMAGP